MQRPDMKTIRRPIPTRKKTKHLPCNTHTANNMILKAGKTVVLGKFELEDESEEGKYPSAPPNNAMEMLMSHDATKRSEWLRALQKELFCWKFDSKIAPIAVDDNGGYFMRLIMN
jgi:hypothetical protein